MHPDELKASHRAITLDWIYGNLTPKYHNPEFKAVPGLELDVTPDEYSPYTEDLT